MTSNASRHFQNALFFLSWMNVRWEAESASPSWNVIIVMKYCRTMPSTIQRTIHASCHYYINHFIRMANDSVTKTFRRSIFPICFFLRLLQKPTHKKIIISICISKQKRIVKWWIAVAIVMVAHVTSKNNCNNQQWCFCCRRFAQ